ncbi:MAG: FAD assembly factor SdhE [bacterium]
MTQTEPDPLRRLRWQCRRGLLELDIAFAHFLDNGYTALSDHYKQIFDSLVQEPDQEILAWLTGEADTPSAAYRELIDLIKNAQRESS